MAPPVLGVFSFDAYLEGLLSLEQVEGNVTQHSEILGRIISMLYLWSSRAANRSRNCSKGLPCTSLTWRLPTPL